MANFKNLHRSIVLTLLAIAPLVYSQGDSQNQSRAQSQAASYEPPRTEFGLPDFQGIWTNRSITRMERRGGAESLVLTDERAEELAQNSLWMSLDREQQNNPITESEAGEAAFETRRHNAFWVDAGFGMQIWGHPSNSKLTR